MYFKWRKKNNENSTQKVSFIIEGEKKSFLDKEKLKQFMTTKPALQKILEGILHVEKIIAFMKTWEKYISPDATISK
jgi:hypothetical protein